MSGVRRNAWAIKLSKLICVALIYGSILAGGATVTAIPYADQNTNVQGGFPLYDLAAFNDPDCVPKTNYVTVTVDPYPFYCEPGAKSEVTDTANFIETRRLSPDSDEPIRTRLFVVPGGSYIAYVTGTMSYTATHLEPGVGWVSVTGTSDAECTTKGAGPYSNNPTTETVTTDTLWVPHRFDTLVGGKMKDPLDVVQSLGNGVLLGEGTDALDGNPNPSPLGTDDWVPTGTSVSVTGQQFFSGCSPTHEYYAYVDVSALKYPLDLMLGVDSRHSQQSYGLQPVLEDADINYIFQQGSDPGCLPRNCPLKPFFAPRKIWSTDTNGGDYSYRGYPCPKWSGEDWITHGAPPGTTRTMDAEVGAISTATLMVDTRKNLDEGLHGNATSGIYNSSFNTYGQTMTVAGNPEFVTSTRADGTRFTHYELTGARGGMITCNWALPGFRYRLETSGTYMYQAGRPAWLNCNYTNPKVFQPDPEYCIKLNPSGQWVVEPENMPPVLQDATYGMGCRNLWTTGPVEDRRDPDATFTEDQLDPNAGNTTILVAGTHLDTVTNTYLGAGNFARRSGYTFDAPNWFTETCTNSYAWQCQAPEAVKEEHEFPYPSTQCILREPDARGDPGATTHRGGTLIGPSTATVVPISEEVVNGVTQTVIDASSTVTATIPTAMADAECSTAPWALTENNKDTALPGTSDPIPAYDPPFTDGASVTGHAMPTDPQWRMGRARGGGLQQGDDELSNTAAQSYYGSFRHKLAPAYPEPPTSTAGVGWFFASYERFTGAPTWVKFTADYHDWHDLYVDSGPLRGWGMTSNSDRWNSVQKQWRPLPGTARTLNHRHNEYGCSTAHRYRYDYFSPAGAGPVQFTISDYDLDLFNEGLFKVTMTSFGPRTDIPRYRDWCKTSQSLSGVTTTAWTLGVPDVLGDGSLSKTCEIARLLKVDWVKADTTYATSTVDEGEQVIVRNTGDVPVRLNGLKLSTARASVVLVSDTAIAIPSRGQARINTHLGITASGQMATVTVTVVSIPDGKDEDDADVVVHYVTTDQTQVNEALDGQGMMYSASMSAYQGTGDAVTLSRPSGSSWVVVSRFRY